MHYFIDGYNMLFRLKHADEDLQKQREELISDLNKKVSLVKLDISIVFDSTYQVGESTRSHFNELEILFTGQGETADEFILEELGKGIHTQQEIVITSDKKLAWQARRRLAQTQTTEEFLIWLNKAYKNKLRLLKNPVDKSKKAFPILKKPAGPKSSVLPPLKAKIEDCQNYYEQIFEKEFQHLMEKESFKKEEKLISKNQHKRAPRKPRQKRSDFPDESPQVPNAPTQMERWLKAFEERLEGNDKK